MEDESVSLNRKQKALLDVIRKDTPDVTRTNTEDGRGHSTPTEYEISGTQSGASGSNRETREDVRSIGRRKKRSTPIEGTMYGPNQGGGQAIPTHEYTPQSNDRTNQETRTEYLEVDNYAPSNEEIVTRDTHEDEERQKELARQRKQRQRANEKQAQIDGVTVTNDVTRSNDIAFKLKNLVTPTSRPVKDVTPKEPIKLITRAEVDDLAENLAFIYKNGSGLLDDILEIIVRGHEDVTIWQLDDDEAETLARMHLEKGRVSKEAAQSARKLLSIYDQLYFIMLLGPRAMQTGKHIIDKGGLSFK